MPGLINEIITNLKSQLENYEYLLGLSLEQKDAVIQNDIAQLKKIVSLENIIINRNRKLEAARVQLTSDIASALGANKETLTLAALAEAIKGQAEHAELVDVKDRLAAVLSDLERENSQNRALVSTALDYIVFSLNLMKDSIENGGAPGAAADRPFFDAKVH